MSRWGLVLGVVLLVVLIWRSNERHSAALQRADSLATVASQQRGQAEAWRSLFTTAQAKIDTVVRVQRVRDLRVDSVLVEVRAEPVPEGCEVIVARHREALDELEISRDGWRDQFTAQREATARLVVAYDTLDAAYTTLNRAYRLARNPPKRFIVAPAVFAGLCTDGQPCAGVGLTLRWGR